MQAPIDWISQNPDLALGVEFTADLRWHSVEGSLERLLEAAQTKPCHNRKLSEDRAEWAAEWAAE